MQEEIVYIQNMGSPRDILLVSKTLESLGLQVKEVEVGTAAYINSGTVSQQEVQQALERCGFNVIDSQEKEFSEQVRQSLSTYIDLLLQGKPESELPHYLETYFNSSFDCINHQYRMLTGTTILEYYKRLRVERAKALLANANLTLVDIAERLSFGNLKNLKRLFAEVTGHPIDRYNNRGLNLDQTAAA